MEIFCCFSSKNQVQVHDNNLVCILLVKFNIFI